MKNPLFFYASSLLLLLFFSCTPTPSTSTSDKLKSTEEIIDNKPLVTEPDLTDDYDEFLNPFGEELPSEIPYEDLEIATTEIGGASVLTIGVEDSLGKYSSFEATVDGESYRICSKSTTFDCASIGSGYHEVTVAACNGAGCGVASAPVDITCPEPPTSSLISSEAIATTMAAEEELLLLGESLKEESRLFVEAQTEDSEAKKAFTLIADMEACDIVNNFDEILDNLAVVEGELSPGEITGIVFGVLVGAAALGVGAWAIAKEIESKRVSSKADSKPKTLVAEVGKTKTVYTAVDKFKNMTTRNTPNSEAKNGVTPPNDKVKTVETPVSSGSARTNATLTRSATTPVSKSNTLANFLGDGAQKNLARSASANTLSTTQRTEAQKAAMIEQSGRNRLTPIGDVGTSDASTERIAGRKNRLKKKKTISNTPGGERFKKIQARMKKNPKIQANLQKRKAKAEARVIVNGPEAKPKLRRQNALNSEEIRDIFNKHAPEATVKKIEAKGLLASIDKNPVINKFIANIRTKMSMKGAPKVAAPKVAVPKITKPNLKFADVVKMNMGLTSEDDLDTALSFEELLSLFVEGLSQANILKLIITTEMDIILPAEEASTL